MVPVTLIRLSRLLEDNWDLTMVKVRIRDPECTLAYNTQVCKFIDGVNHVSRIAQLAECDVELVRMAIAHLL